MTNNPLIWLHILSVTTALIICLWFFLVEATSVSVETAARVVSIFYIITVLLVIVHYLSFWKRASGVFSTSLKHKVWYIILTLLLITSSVYSFFGLFTPCPPNDIGVCHMFIGLGVALSYGTWLIGLLIYYFYSRYIVRTGNRMSPTSV